MFWRSGLVGGQTFFILIELNNVYQVNFLNLRNVIPDITIFTHLFISKQYGFVFCK